MTASRKVTFASLLRGVAWLFFVMAGLAFWVGGRAISEFAKTERMFAEMEGFALAVLFGGLGAVAKTAADRVKEDEGEISLPGSLRK